MPSLPPNPEAARRELAEGDELIVYRVVRVPDPDDPEFVNSFLSHRELGIPPRGPQIEHPVIYDGVSVYETREAAIETARTWPKLGGYVAELRITAESGVLYLRWAHAGHLTLWGDPLTLSETVVDTIPVEGEM